MKEKLYENAALLPELIKLINEGHTITLKLKGVSMRPFLEHNRDKAVMSKVEKPKVGDPILAEISKGVFVLHRIIAIDGKRVVLRGDGNLNNEECRVEDLRASIIGFYRKGRNTIDLVDGRKWKIYSAVWMRLYPIRRYLLAFYRRIWIPMFGTI